MSTPIEIPRPARLWKSLSDERRLAAAQAFWEDEHAVAEQAEAVGLLARQIHFRPRSVVTLPNDRKARLLARTVAVPETVAARLLVTYHLAAQRPMMKAFLDAAGVANEDGLIGEEAAPPEAEKVRAAARGLFSAFPEEDVRLYFSTLVLQDADTWVALTEVLQERSTP